MRQSEDIDGRAPEGAEAREDNASLRRSFAGLEDRLGAATLAMVGARTGPLLDLQVQRTNQRACLLKPCTRDLERLGG